MILLTREKNFSRTFVRIGDDVSRTKYCAPASFLHVRTTNADRRKTKRSARWTSADPSRKRRPAVLLTPPSAYTNAITKETALMFQPLESREGGAPAQTLPPHPTRDDTLPFELRDHIRRLRLILPVISVSVMALHRQNAE